MATESTRKADPQAGIYFPLQGALRAALDAYLQASSPQTLDGSASSAITGNGLPASHPAGIVPSPAARFGTATLANRQTAFDNLLNLWTGVDSIAAGARSGGLSLRQATVLELAYGTGYQNGDGEQAAVWDIAYRRLTEGVYASLAAQTHLSGDYALIDWRVYQSLNGGLGEEIGQLEALTAAFKQRLAEVIAAETTAGQTARNIPDIEKCRDVCQEDAGIERDGRSRKGVSNPSRVRPLIHRAWTRRRKRQATQCAAIKTGSAPIHQKLEGESHVEY